LAGVRPRRNGFSLLARPVSALATTCVDLYCFLWLGSSSRGVSRHTVSSPPFGGEEWPEAPQNFPIEIVTAAREGWHPNKLNILRAKFVEGLRRVGASNFIPQGRGKFVPPPAQGQFDL
jgi:hypothetical protein